MNDSFIEVPTTGKNLNTKLVQTEAGSVHNEIVQVYNNALGDGELTKDAWGVQKVSVPHSTFHGMFTFDIPSSMWFIFEDGVETSNTVATNVFSQEGAGHILGNATHNVALLESRECPRYQPNRGLLFSTALVMPNPTNDGVRDFGLGTSSNGVFFRLKSDGNLYAVIKSGGVETQEQIIDVAAKVTDWSADQRHVYDIQCQWRGMGNYKFYVDLQLVAEIVFLGTVATGVTIENPAFPAFFKSTRTTQDVEIIVGCCDITSENGQTDKEQYGSSYAENVTVNGTDAPVLAIYNPPTIDSEINTRTVTLARISVKCSKKATFKVWRTRDGTTFTGATFVEIDNGSTHMQTDSPDMVTGAVRATAVTLTNSVIVRPIPVEAAKETQVDNPYRGRIEFPVVRGDYIFITCTASTATAEAVFEWGEQI